MVAQVLAAGVTLGKIARRDRRAAVRRHQIYACQPPEEVVDLLRQGHAVFGLALGSVLERMRGSVVA